MHVKQIRRLEDEIKRKKLLISDLRASYYESGQTVNIDAFNSICNDVYRLEQELLYMRIGCCLYVIPYNWVDVFKKAKQDDRLKKYSKDEIIDYFSYQQYKFLEFIYN